jgi:hypothetical protein
MPVFEHCLSLCLPRPGLFIKRRSSPSDALHQATLLKSGARLRGIARGRPIGAAGVRPVCPSLNKDRKATMARKPATRVEFTLFDVVYQDGSQRSNRRVPSEVLSGLDGDAPARAIIEEQDRLIAEKSGIPAISVKSIYRSDSKKADEAVRSLLSASASKR